VGFKYFVIPVPPMGLRDDHEQLATVLAALGEKCHKAGLKLLYHNHDFEFKKSDDGIVTIDYLLENTDSKYVNFQMDLYWVVKAGKDPLAYFDKYPGRFKMWHVKDMNAEGKFAPVGKGQINFSKILAQKKLSGMKYYMVEQDNTFDLTPLEAIKISHKGLIDIGFK
jgi:sugar phosphate isomerase/epimerase